MRDRLFGGSWHSSWSAMLHKAAEEVNRLPRQVFSDPGLVGQLQRIAENYSVEIARLDRKGISAVRRVEERPVDDYGRRHFVQIKWLDVTIPFSGEAESLKVTPSSCTLPSHHAAIQNDCLILSIRDDDSAEREVQSFCDIVEENLKRLRAEYERDKPSLMETINQVAERRRREIEDENTRDRKLSFPIRN